MQTIKKRRSNMKQTKTASIILFTVAIIFLLFGLLFKNHLSSFFIGLGSGFIGASVASLIKYKKFANNPEYTKKYNIETHDPRNMEIKTKALAQSGSILSILIVLLSLLTSATQQPLWITATLVGLFLVHAMLTFYFITKLNKTM